MGLIFSAKLERWPRPPEFVIAMLRAGGGEACSREALVDLKGSDDGLATFGMESAIVFLTLGDAWISFSQSSDSEAIWEGRRRASS